MRRLATRWLCILLAALPTGLAAADFAAVTPGYRITFPRDAGSHPDFRIEWWYVTGWVAGEDGRPRGFQVTFFRNRPGLDEQNPSRFAARQLLFAHAAVSDPAVGRLLHDERVARAGFGIAEAATDRLDVVLEDWSIRQQGDAIDVVVAGQEFALSLTLTPAQPPLLQGFDGFSQKGPEPRSASHYYSLPHVRVAGRMTVRGRDIAVSGSAWFDHEWSSELLDEAAQGWDWTGINLADGGALMAFRIRDGEGGAHWAAASRREAPVADGTPAPRSFAAADVEWQPLRHWRSPRTGITYPVEWRLRVGAAEYRLRPLFDDQESDSRRSTGTIYWEGAVELLDAQGAVAGRGYLELTGYGSRLRL